jgi:hypothetical protein
MPDGARAAAGADAHLHILSPDGHTAHEFFDFQRTDDGATAEYYVVSDLTGSGVLDGGTRAYGGSALGGLIRTWELEKGEIRHALALALGGQQLRRGPVWPADSEDDNSLETYSGQIPMGALLAIPETVSVEAMQLSPDGLVVARALQRYGAYVVDQARDMTFYAEPSAAMDRIERIREDLPRIRRELRIVANNGPDRVGGGGRPIAPLAPPLR